MDRRELLQLGAATAATAAFAAKASAQTPGVPAGWKNSLNAYSRTLHWLRTPEEVAEACHEIGNTTIDLTVRPYPGHVQPEKVKTDLPVWVNGLKRNGITVQMIPTSEIRVSCVIHSKYTELAVRALHTAFGLDRADSTVAKAG